MAFKLKVRTKLPAFLSVTSPLTRIKNGVSIILGLDINELRTSLDPIYGARVTGPGTSTDKAVPRFSGVFGTVLQNSLVTIDDVGKTFIPDFSSAVDLTGTLVVGTGGLNNSLRSAYQIRRTLSDAGTSFHGYSDNTLFNGVTGAGYGSFDSRPNYIGVLPNDHFNSFQSLLNYNNSAVMQVHQGLVWAPQVNNGQVVSMYAMHVQAPLITAPGVAPTNLAGIVIDDLTASGGAGVLRAILTSGSTASEFGGLVITYGGVIARAPGLGYLFQSALNATQGSLVHNGTNLTISNFINGSVFLGTNSVNIAEVTSAAVRPVTDSGPTSGDATHRWNKVYTVGLAGTTTNNNASAGDVGEYVEGILTSGSATALVTSTAKTITSISLTAGDWDVDGIFYMLPANTTSVTQVVGCLSLVTNTLDTTAGRVVSPAHPTIVYNGTVSAACTIPNYRFSLSATTTIFLVGFSVFTVAANTGFGIIRARRIR